MTEADAGTERRGRPTHPPEQAHTPADEIYVGTLLRREGRGDQVIRRKGMRLKGVLAAMAGASVLCCVAFGLAGLLGAPLPHTGSTSAGEHPLRIVPADSPDAPANVDTEPPGPLPPLWHDQAPGQQDDRAIAQPSSGSQEAANTSTQRRTVQVGDQNTARPSAPAGAASAPAGAPAQPSSASPSPQPASSSPPVPVPRRVLTVQFWDR
jgi:hypothetical protein